jgi:HD superfamily phosphohydrolase
MKARVFRDPVHGLIELDGDDAALGGLLDTAAMQRLRRVRQMGFAWLVYPGAEHSRFSHALGALHVAQRVTRALGLDLQVARDVRIAALLHDIGHGPYSHAWEEALGGASHEAWGRRIIAEDPELGAALDALGPGQRDRVLALCDDRYTPRFARKLVSSQLDVDRMDYLLRDAHFSGVGYSAYDLEWIVHALRVDVVRPGVADGRDLVVDYGRGMHAVEQYLFGRSYMYAQVYYHKTVRAAEWMFTLLMRRVRELALVDQAPPGLPAVVTLARSEPLAVADYLALDDGRVTTVLADWAAGAARDPVVAELAGRLVHRRLYKTRDLPDDAAALERLRAGFEAAATRVLGARAPYAWALDRAASLGYSDRPGEEIYVVGHPSHEGTTDLGRLVDDLPLGRRRSAVRVIMAPELRDAFERVISAG